MSELFDIAVIGAGIAGASIAAELAPHAKVVVLEGEAHPGYHTTGRSAAFWEECYGGPGIVPLTLASRAALESLGALSTRGALYIARAEQEEALDTFMAQFAGTGVTIEKVADRQRLVDIIPGLRPEWTLAVSEPACADIDVARVHQHYLSNVKRGGAQLRVNAQVQAIEREGGQWRLDLGKAGEMRAGMVVNASGAWADGIAQMAGARPLGIQPFRRTVAQLRVDPPAPTDLPMVLDLAGEFYFKPESGRLWLSPHDETPSPPCDAAPEELDVALAIDRMQGVVDWRIAAVERKWAGLRSFAPDRLPVIGFASHEEGASDCEGLFWFAGQGGFGIQTAPAAARLGAQVLLGHSADEMTASIDPAAYSPARFGARFG